MIVVLHCIAGFWCGICEVLCFAVLIVVVAYALVGC